MDNMAIKYSYSRYAAALSLWIILTFFYPQWIQANDELLAAAKNGRALSMKVLQQKLRQCKASGGACSSEVRHLAGITELLGYIVDKEHGDLILIGRADPQLSPIHTEDLIIALKNIFKKYTWSGNNKTYYSPPLCSIDPDPDTFKKLQQAWRGAHNRRLKDLSWRNDSANDFQTTDSNHMKWHKLCEKPQSVLVRGVPFESRFARIMVDADYLLKRLINGSEHLALPKFSSLTAMKSRILQQHAHRNTEPKLSAVSMNRFWFHAGNTTFIESDDIVLIKDCEVGLSTEEEFFVRGQRSSSGHCDRLASKFAAVFAANYDKIAESKPIYKELANLYRSMALASIIHKRNGFKTAGLNASYVLDQIVHVPAIVGKTRKGVPHLARVSIELHNSRLEYYLMSCGGVKLDPFIREAPLMRGHGGMLSMIRSNVLMARPSAAMLSWPYSVGAVLPKKKKKRPHESKPDSSDAGTPTDNPALQVRIKDDVEASRTLKTAVIMDYYEDDDQNPHLVLAQNGGEVEQKSVAAAEQLKTLMNETINMHGKVPPSLQSRWEEFYTEHLKAAADRHTQPWPKNRKVAIKPVLVIKSNQVNHQYPNLQKIRVLRDNFLIFLAFKKDMQNQASETPAVDVIRNIREIPPAKASNLMLVIRQPDDVAESDKRDMIRIVGAFSKLIGSDRVLYNPGKEQFSDALRKKNKDVVVVEVTHTNNAIMLQGGEKITSRDILSLGDLSHIRYLLGGYSCELAQIEDGELVAALRNAGVKAINVNNGKVSDDTVRKRLDRLLNIIPHGDVPAFYLQDIIDQLLDIDEKEKGTTNLVKKENEDLST